MLRRQSFKCRRPLETQRTFSLCKPQGEWQNRSGFMKISMTVIKRMNSGKVKAGRTIREWLSLSREQKEQSENRSSEEREEIRRRDVIMKRALRKEKRNSGRDGDREKRQNKKNSREALGIHCMEKTLHTSTTLRDAEGFVKKIPGYLLGSVHLQS